MSDQLPHTTRTQELLKKGEREKAREAHNARVESELDRARKGETINLSDLMAAKEQLDLDA
jgi:hypothetical protein